MTVQIYDGLGWTVETVRNAGAHLVGAATYEAWAGYWPSASGPFTKPMNEIPKVVSSDSLEPASTTVFSGGAVAHVFAAHP